MTELGGCLQPLLLNFPHDFLPERSLLARLLPFASKRGCGDKVQIGGDWDPTGRVVERWSL